MSLVFRLVVTLALLGVCLSASVLQRRGLSDEDKTVILNEHNKHRANVNPTATNMRKMYWSDDLARSAQAWAETCGPPHDSNEDRERNSNIGVHVGQNYGRGQPSWTGFITACHSEVNYYDYATDGKVSGYTGYIGHYTQLVNAESPLVGCGETRCDRAPHVPVRVCNYAIMHYGRPYKNGTSCAECKDKCVDGKLCDCGTKLCHHGSMNLNDCSCDCNKGYMGENCEITCKPCVLNYSYHQKGNNCSCKCRDSEDGGHYYGEQCEKFSKCASADPDYCKAHYTDKHCKMWWDLQDECPHLCGFCNNTTQTL